MSRGRVVTIRLNDRERTALRTLADDKQLSATKAKWPKIILLAAEGWSTTKIAKTLHTSPKLVSRWQNRFAREGMGCLIKDWQADEEVVPDPSDGSSSPEKVEQTSPTVPNFNQSMPNGFGGWGGMPNSAQLNGSAEMGEPKAEENSSASEERAPEQIAPELNGAAANHAPMEFSEADENPVKHADDKEAGMMANGRGEGETSPNGHANVQADAEGGKDDREDKKVARKPDTPVNGAGGGKGGGPNGSDLHKRSDDPDFRNALAETMAELRKHATTVGIFSVAVNLLILSIPIYLFQVSDRVLTSRSHDTLIMLTIVVLGALAVHVALDMMRRFLLMRAAVQMETRLGAPVLSAAVKSCQSSSSKEFQALSDLNQVRNFVTGPVMLTFFDAPIAPVFFLAVYLIHPHLGYIITGAALLVLVVALINQKMTAVPFARAGGFAMRANLQADSMARNALVMNAMGMIREGVQLWGRDTAEQLKSQIVAQDRNIVMTGVSKFIRLATQVVMLGWGAHLALAGELTGGMIIAASIIGSRALAPVVGTIEGWGSFVHARNGYGRIKALLQSSPLNLQRLRLPRPVGSLTVERVLFVPPPSKKIILNGISFKLEPGDSLAIMGSSGTGKTTLARMLVGSISPTAGSVRLDKMDIRHWDPRQFGECIGYLPQDVELFPATIKDNISRMRYDVTDESIFNAAELAGVHDMISQLPQGYETPIAVDGAPLSGGQKQRIGLARAFFGEPQLVVLDEPNSNLDKPGETALGQALKRAKERKITVVTVTQRPSLLRSVDKIMLLKEGKIQLMGQRDEVIKQIADGRMAA